VARFQELPIVGGFDKVAIGARRAEVVRNLGSPDEVEPCGTLYGGPPNAACAKELRYSHTFAPWIPHYWIIELDKDDRVVDKQELDSP
jgi:hypothetical protein